MCQSPYIKHNQHGIFSISFQLFIQEFKNVRIYQLPKTTALTVKGKINFMLTVTSAIATMRNTAKIITYLWCS